MNRNENLMEKFIENLTQTAMNSSIAELILPKKIKGNLINVLKSFDKEELLIIADNYFDKKKIASKNLTEITKMLEEKIKEQFPQFLDYIPYKQLKQVEKLINDQESDISDSFIFAGFAFIYRDKENVKAWIPDDLKELAKNKITKEVKTKCIETDIYSKGISLFFSLGLVPEENLLEDYKEETLLKDILKELKEMFIIKNINGKNYLWFNKIEYKEDYGDINSLENMRYIKRPENEESIYMIILLKLVEDINKVLKEPYENILSTALTTLVAKKREPAEIVEDFTTAYNLSKAKQQKIEKIVNDNYEILRFWDHGGKNIDEIEMERYLLKEKPKKRNLESCINLLEKDVRKELEETYMTEDISELKEGILDDCETMLDNFFELEELEELLQYDDSIYDGNSIITTVELRNYIYLYEEKGQERVIIPVEIKEILKKLIDIREEEALEMEPLDDREIIGNYMIYNGIIEKEILQKLLKENHELDYSIDELNTAIKSLDFYSDEYFFSVIDELDQSLAKSILEKKKLQKNYKRVDELCYKDFEKIDSFYDELEDCINLFMVPDETKEELLSIIPFFLHINFYNIDMLMEYVNDKCLGIKKSDCKKIDNIISKYKNIIPCWTLNGYSIQEVNSMPKKQKIGRNDPCPCGSGKKYKKCCGKNE